MKKLLAFLLIVTVLVSILSVTAYAVDRIETAQVEKVIIEQPPCFGDYEVIPPEVSILAVNRDIHESNNSFSYATLRPVELDEKNPKKFKVIAGGTIHRETWLFGLIERKVDEDYYRFDLQGEATVRIILEDIPQYCDYEMELWHFKNEKFVTIEDIERVAYSCNIGVTPEEIVCTLPAGTYYIRIYSYNETYNDTESYSLSVKGQYTYQDVSISTLQNSGAVAAIWRSDFDLCGIKPFTTNSEVTVGYRNHSTFNEEDAFANPYFAHFNTNERIEHASIYFWGVNTRKDIADELKKHIDAVEAEISSLSNVKLIVDCVSTITETIYQIVTIDVSTGKQLMLSLVDGTPGALIKTFFPADSWIANKNDFLAYLRYLYNGVQAGPNTSETEVIRISSSYIITTDYDTSQIQYFNMDYAPQDIILGSLYMDDYIYGNSEYSYSYGHIYTVYDLEDIEQILS